MAVQFITVPDEFEKTRLEGDSMTNFGPLSISFSMASINE